MAASLATLNHSGVAMFAASPQLKPTQYTLRIIRNILLLTERITSITTTYPPLKKKSEEKSIFEPVTTILTMTEPCVIGSWKCHNKFPSILY